MCPSKRTMKNRSKMKRRDFLSLVAIAGSALALSPIGVLATPKKKHPEFLAVRFHSFKEGDFTIHTSASMDWFFSEKHRTPDEWRKSHPPLRVSKWKELTFGRVEVSGEGGEHFLPHDTLIDESGELWHLLDRKDFGDSRGVTNLIVNLRTGRKGGG